MAMFAASLKTLQKRASQIVKEASRRPDNTEPADATCGFDVNIDSGQLAYAARDVLDQLGQSSGPGGSTVVRYVVQNADDEDRDVAAFVIPEDTGTTRVTTIRSLFPLPGRFHFRFKAHMPDRAFGGSAWVDVANDSEPAPLYKGTIMMKVLRLPDDTDQPRTFDSVQNSLLAEAQSQAFADRDARGSPGASGLAGLDLGGSPPSSSPYSSPPETSRISESPPPQSRASYGQGSLASPGRGSAGSPPPASSAAYASAAPQQPPPPKPAAAPVLDDLIEMDFGGSAKAKPPPWASMSSMSATPATPSKPLDRGSLIAEREAGVRAAVEATYAKTVAVRDAEEAIKVGKRDAANAIGEDMDRWARTPDNQAWKDVRTLLSTMHAVVWPNSGWTPVSLAELVGTDSNVKRSYRKAIILTHPDRHQDASAEQQVRADRIFQALNESFKLSANP